MSQRYVVHKTKVETDIGIGIPSFFKKDFEGDADLTVKENGDCNVGDAKPFFPPYIFFRQSTLLHKYGFLVPTSLSMSDLEGEAVIEYTPMYKRLLDLKEVARCVLDMKIMQSGLYKTHASCVQLPNGKGVLFAGWDHSGKSTLAINLVGRGAKFLSDDTTLIGETSAYCYPKPIKKFTGMTPMAKRLNSIPFVNRMLGLNTQENPKDVVESTRVSYVFILRYGDRGIEKIKAEDAAMTLELLGMYVTEILDHRHLILEYSHYNKLDLPGLIGRRTDVIRKFLRGVECYEVTATNVTDSEEMISKVIES